MLRIHFSDNRQAPIWLVEERFTIGRDSRNQLVLNDPGIAPFHAEIRQDQGFYYLSDLGSENGTLVNGERVGARFQLRAEDRVSMGPVQMHLVDPGKGPARPESSTRWFLQVIQGEHEGRKFHISGSMTFGRSVKCELCFSDQELSRRHCEFYLKDDVLEVKDLASANGILVNQQKVATAVLQSGDQLKMGSVTLLVIGPKVQVSQAVDEDATVFMRAVDLPKPVKRLPPINPAVTANPLRAAAQDKPAPAPSAAMNKRWLLMVLLVLIGLAALLVSLWR